MSARPQGISRELQSPVNFISRWLYICTIRAATDYVSLKVGYDAEAPFRMGAHCLVVN